MQAAWWTDFGQWLMDLLLWVPRKLFSLLLDSLASVLEAIPVPDFMSGLAGWASALDPAIAYFSAPLQIGTGIGFVFAAYVLRFAIRRIPVIG